MPTDIAIVEADITTLPAGAIVNAANETLLGGGGVDGAIHRAAGPELLEACRRLPEVAPGIRCPTGDARITPGFALPARFVIHTVGPVWRGGSHGEAELLARCHRRSLQLAAAHGLRRVVFPAISCGAYGYPVAEAAAIAVASIRQALQDHEGLEVSVCCFGAATFDAFWAAAAATPAAGRQRRG